MSNRQLIIEAAPGAGPNDAIGEHYMLLDGVTGSYASTPDHSSLDITGDIDIRVDVRMPTWFRGGQVGQVISGDRLSINEPLIGKWSSTSDQRSWVLSVSLARVILGWTTAGTTGTVQTSWINATDVGLLTPGRRLILRVTLDVNNGAGGITLAWYYSDPLTGGTVDAGPWTPLAFGSNTDPGTTSIFASTTPLHIGQVTDPAWVAGTLAGKVYAAQVRNGIGGTVQANPNFAGQANGTTSFADSAGKTWTLNGGTDIVGYDWYDFSDRGLDAEWEIGRDDELEDFPAGHANLVLRNYDRQLDPDHVAGTWFGKLLPRTPVRIRSRDVDTLSIDDEFYGFVSGGWQQEPVGPNVWRCRLELDDRLAVLSGFTLPDVFDQTITLREPQGFWVLDSPTSADEIADLGSGRNDATVVGNVQFRERPVRQGHDDAALFEARTAAEPDRPAAFVQCSDSSPVVTGGGDMDLVTVMATFRMRSAGTYVLTWQTNGNTRPTGFSFANSPTGQLLYARVDNGNGVLHTSTAGWLDGRGHLAIADGTGIAVDSAVPSDTSVAASSSAGAPVNGFAIGGGAGEPTVQWDGWIGAVAAWDRPLLEAERELILTGYNKLDGQRSDQHIAWALDQIGVLPDFRDLSQGSVHMGPAKARDRDALEWMRDVARTEGGALYVDHRGGGKLRFTDRYHRFTATRSTVSQATFSDAPNAAGVVNYANDGFDLSPNGLDAIINQVAVNWRDGTVTVEDAESIARYGPRQRQFDTEATTAAQARSTAEWTVVRKKDPKSRIRSVTALPKVHYARSGLVQDREVHDLVTVLVHPMNIGDPITTNVHVDGIKNAVTGGVAWETSFRFSQPEELTPWIWGTSRWGETTVWG